MGSHEWRVALSMARSIRYWTHRIVKTLAARRNEKHSDFMGPSTGFLEHDSSYDGSELRHEHGDSAADDFRSAPGSRDHPKQCELSGAVWPGVSIGRRRSHSISRPSRSHAKFSYVQHLCANDRSDEVARFDAVASDPQHRAAQGQSDRTI